MFFHFPLIFLHFLSFSFIFSFPFIDFSLFFHFLSFTFFHFLFLFVGCSKSDFFVGLNFVTISPDSSYVKNQFWCPSRGVCAHPFGPSFPFFTPFFSPVFCFFSCITNCLSVGHHLVISEDQVESRIWWAAGGSSPSYQNRQMSALDETADAPQSSLFSLLSSLVFLSLFSLIFSHLLLSCLVLSSLLLSILCRLLFSLCPYLLSLSLSVSVSLYLRVVSWSCCCVVLCLVLWCVWCGVAL